MEEVDKIMIRKWRKYCYSYEMLNCIFLNDDKDFLMRTVYCYCKKQIRKNDQR